MANRSTVDANERSLTTVTTDCIDATLGTVEKPATVEKLAQLPAQHLLVLHAMTAWTERASGKIVQPVTTSQLQTAYEQFELPEQDTISDRAIREIVTDLETMGLVETWVDSRGRDGRVKQVETTFDPTWVEDAEDRYRERRTDATK